MQETPKKKSALGWILCLISMVAVFCLGLLAASICEFSSPFMRGSPNSNTF